MTRGGSGSLGLLPAGLSPAILCQLAWRTLDTHFSLLGKWVSRWLLGKWVSRWLSDPIHMCLSIPPKLSVAYTIGRLKGKSAVRIHREFIKRRGNAKWFNFWSTGYCVSTVGLDEAKVRQYIRHQEEQDRRQEEFDLDD